MSYSLSHIVHLFCAFVFVGAVFFEVLIMEGARKKVPPEYMEALQKGIMSRARKIMPYVVGTIFISGLYMAYVHLWQLESWFATSFSTLLIVKIIIASSVLVHFVTALTFSSRGKMTSKRFKFIHLSVFSHMVLIILLAKGMFYFSW